MSVTKLERIMGNDRVRERATRLSDRAGTLLFADQRGADTSHAMHCVNGIRVERCAPPLDDAFAVTVSTIDDGTLTMALEFVVDATGRQRGRGMYNAFGAGFRHFDEGSEQTLVDGLLDALVEAPADYWDRRE